MIFQFFEGYEHIVRGAIARNIHSRWLTKAMRSGSRTPRIPTRMVSRGGFDAEMSNQRGRKWAEEWWNDVLSRPDLDGD